jgi:hypothetical protein
MGTGSYAAHFFSITSDEKYHHSIHAYIKNISGIYSKV